jgi:hypothetical protein
MRIKFKLGSKPFCNSVSKKIALKTQLRKTLEVRSFLFLGRSLCSKVINLRHWQLIILKHLGSLKSIGAVLKMKST